MTSSLILHMEILTNSALNMDVIPMRIFSAIVCMVSVFQQFHRRRPLKMRKDSAKNFLGVFKVRQLRTKVITKDPGSSAYRKPTEFYTSNVTKTDLQYQD